MVRGERYAKSIVARRFRSATPKTPVGHLSVTFWRSLARSDCHVPSTQPQPGWRDVRIHAAEVNHTNTMARNGSRAEQQNIATRILEHFPHGVDKLADGAVLNEKVIPAVRAARGGAVAHGVEQPCHGAARRARVGAGPCR